MCGSDRSDGWVAADAGAGLMAIVTDVNQLRLRPDDQNIGRTLRRLYREVGPRLPRGQRPPGPPGQRWVDAALGYPSRRLAAYGSLCPDETNHHRLNGLTGGWTECTAFGRVVPKGWGSDAGFPGFVAGTPHQNGGVRVQLFESADLPDHWDRLDRFEGKDYRRLLTPVYDDRGRWKVANMYHIAPHLL